MKVVKNLAMRAAPWAIPLLTIGIFVFDLFAPVGVAVSILYIVPLLLTFLSSRERDPFYFCIVATSLMWIDLFLKSPGIPIPYGMFNQVLGTVVLWGVALGLIRYKRTQHGLVEAEADKTKAMRELMSERVERAHAEGLMTAAQEARAYTDTALLGAISSRRDMEVKLLAAKVSLEGIVQSAMDAIITVDEEQQVLLFNHAAEQMFRCSAVDAVGKPLDKFIPSRFRTTHHHHVAEFGKSGTTTRMMGSLGQVTGLRADGEEFPVEASISQAGVEGKKYFTVILRDITQRKRLEAAQAHFESLVASSEDAIIGESLDGLVLSWNRAAEDMTGYTAQEVIGRPLSDFLPKEDSEKERNFLALVVRGESIDQYEAVRIRKDGRPLYVSLTISPIRNDQGHVIGASRIVRDITEKKKLQEELHRAEHLAELGTLASGMAHEIGTPMNVILGRAEYLMDRVTDEPVKKGLKTIVAQVERITKVMNQLLAFARRKPPERSPLLLKDIVENSLELFQERLARSRVTAQLALDDSCPKVQADPDQMSQVMINLLMNAVHAMPNGGTIRIGLAPEKDMVKLTVADTGHGIPQEDAKKIFEPFFTTKESGKGTGLGLTVIKGIIEEHQGSIAVESEPGKGTTFTILLPQSL